MNADWVDLIIKVLLLFILSGIAEILMASRMWKSGLFTTAIFISVFRRTFLTAIAVYVGLFRGAHRTEETAILQNMLMSGWAVVFTDTLILITSLGFMAEVVTNWKKIKSKIKKHRLKKN